MKNKINVVDCVIHDKKQVAVDIFLLSMRCPKNINKTFIPGQFINIKIEESNILLRRPFGIFDIEKNIIKILFKVVGNGTQILSQYNIGQKLNIVFPLGNGFDIKYIDNNKENKFILIAGGLGIVPLYPLIKYFNRKKYLYTLIQGYKNKTDVFLKTELSRLTNNKTIFTTEDGSCGKKGLVIDCFSDKIDSNTIIFACGPKKMFSSLQKVVNIQYPETEMFFSLESFMGCGFGACLSCAKFTVDNDVFYVCKDGPVVNSRLISG